MLAIQDVPFEFERRELHLFKKRDPCPTSILGVKKHKRFYIYGPFPTVFIQDLASYAESIAWRSKSVDPTGLIWMGARYYDPETGRFLSPAPVRQPLNLDLYAYANGDPINFVDLGGALLPKLMIVLRITLSMRG